MNGEIPSVPITTLAGVASLTDLLPELPLPTPLPHSVSNKSLLYHSSLREEANKLLNADDDNLVSQLVSSLRKTSTDNIELKDGAEADPAEGDVPPLLKAILSYDQHAFKGGPTYCNAQTLGGVPTSNHQHPSPFEAGPSPCTPESPARVPTVPSAALHQAAPANPYQAAFLNFARQQESGEPSKKLTSPARASAAPTDQQKSPGNGKQAVVVLESLQESATLERKDTKRQTTNEDDFKFTRSPSVKKNPLQNQNPNTIENDEEFATLTPKSGSAAEKSQTITRRKSLRNQNKENVITMESRVTRSVEKKNENKEHTKSEEDFRESSSGESSTKKKKHKKEEDNSYNVVNDVSSSKLTLKISKGSKESKKDKYSSGSKRKRLEDEDRSSHVSETSNHSTNSNDVMVAEFAPSLSERVKRRRTVVNYSEGAGGEKVGAESDDDVVIVEKPDREERPPSSAKSKKRRKNEDNDWRPLEDNSQGAGPMDTLPPTAIRRHDQERDRNRRNKDTDSSRGSDHDSTKGRRGESRKKLFGPVVMLEDCMEYSPTQKKFMHLIDACMEAAEDIDLSELNADDDTGDSIIGPSTLSELCYEAAKLKSMGCMNLVPFEKLVKLLTILQFNIRDGCKTMPVGHDEDHDDEHLLLELTLEKIMAAIDAGLVSLYVMTSKDMPKQVFLEDVIDKLVRMAKTQLQNTVFPEFDPVYRLDPKNKTGYQGNLKAKRARSGGTKNKMALQIYNKLTELIGYLSELVEIQELTDTIILQASTLSVSPFFVENINELQLNSLKLVTSIFSKYDKHRQLILEDILASLARLPSSKKNLRSYRLNSDEQIQMVSALVLQLIQCVVTLPQQAQSDEPGGEEENTESTKNNALKDVDCELAIQTSYENAMRTAHNFLSVFLKKCTTKGEEDYRHLFENFVYDLLATVNKPEWPAAELILSLLGRLLVQQFSNKSVDMSLRVASLDYLGIIASRLRKDAVSSKLNEKVIDQIIRHIQGKDDDDYEPLDDFKAILTSDEDDNKIDENKDGSEQEKESKDTDQEEEIPSRSKKKKKRKSRRSSRRSSIDSKDSNDDEEEEDIKSSKKKKSSKSSKEKEAQKVVDTRTQNLQQSLLEYLVYNAQNDPALIFAREFYIGQWYKDCVLEVERASRSLEKVKSDNEKFKNEDDDVAKELDKLKEIQQVAEVRKNFLMSQINTKISTFASFKPSPSRLVYDNACLVTRYLASSRPFSQSFEVYLTQILKVLCETAVAVRTRAMKCLSLVVEADPSILGRADMKGGVHGRLLDHSTSVREAAVELVGKFIHNRPDLAEQYYDMLSDRILDTGISVRKRVIKIFRDICSDQPEFTKIPEMCVKMIRRVNDEEGIKKLVNETFQNMWFTPLSEREENITGQLRTKVMNITDVVNACRDTGYEWFEHLLENLLKKEETTKDKPVERACMQLIECLIENVLKLENTADAGEGRGTCSLRLVACIATLHLFCKVKPLLMVRQATTLQPYLDIKCIATGDFMVIHNIARMLELSVPLMEHPSENFLAQLEEDMMKLILKHGMMVLQSCVSCLGAIVNKVTHNYNLVRDCFQKFFGVLSRLMQEHKRDPRSPQLVQSMPTMLRSLFTVGLLCRHFDFDSENFGEKRVSIKDRVFDVLMYFVTHEEEDVRHKALSGIGFFATRHYEFMMGKELKELYQDLLVNKGASVKMCCQVLRNLNHYLIEEEIRMMQAEDEWKKQHDHEDLKEMGDVQSGMASTIIQVYIKQLLESFFHAQSQVRLAALNVVVLVLRQGLVHPVQIVPYLISMGSDCDTNIRIKADQQLAEIDKKYPGFIQMKAIQGVKMSFRLQEILQQDPCEPIRGIRMEDNPVSLCNFIYSLIRNNRGQRRGMLTSILNLFDDSSFPDLVSEEEGNQASELILPKLTGAIDKAFDKFESYILTNIFEIPKHVVLPEDQVHIGKEYTERHEQQLDTDLEQLTDKIKCAKYINTQMQKELKELEELQKMYDHCLDLQTKTEKTCFQMGVSDLKEAVVFNNERAVGIQNIIQKPPSQKTAKRMARSEQSDETDCSRINMKKLKT